MKSNSVIAERMDKIVYQDGSRVIKVFDVNYSKANVLNEALNHARVEETELPIPKLLEVTKIEDKWAIITEFIQGRTLESLMQEDEEKCKEYLDMFLNIQVSVHSKKSPLLNNLKDKLHRKIAETDLTETIKYDLHTKLESLPKHEKVCHGDFNPSNIIIANDGTPYILDWSHATQGNASGDAASTYILFWLAGHKEIAQSYLDLYCVKTKTSKEYVQQWIPIVAASLLTTSKPEQKDLLMHWIDVVDYE